MIYMLVGAKKMGSGQVDVQSGGEMAQVTECLTWRQSDLAPALVADVVSDTVEGSDPAAAKTI